LKKRHFWRRGIGLGILTVVGLATLIAQTKWKGSVVKEGDVTIITNPKEPLFKGPILELEEDLSLGGPEAQGDYAFGKVQTFIVDGSGSVYVLDRMNFNVKIFDPSGRHLRTFGRKGQGPGEFEYPYTLSLNQTSGELALHELGDGITYFNTDGTFLRHVSLKTALSLRAVVDEKGDIYVQEYIRKGDEAHDETKKLASDGSLIASIAEGPSWFVFKPDPFRATSYFLIDQANNLVFGQPLTYEIRFYGPADTKVFKKIMRDYDPVAVTAAEREREDQRRDPRGAPTKHEFSKYHSAFRRFFTSDLGHLFVETWETTSDGKKIHDIFDAEGRYIGRMPLKPSGITILKGKYYALEEDEDGYQYVKRYAVTWRVK
jgi:hypothetical protein